MEEYIQKKWRKYAQRNYERETRDFAAFLLSECTTALRSNEDVSIGSSSKEASDIMKEKNRQEEILLNRVSLLERDSAEMRNINEELKRKLEAMESMDNDDYTGIQLKHDQMCKELQEKNEELLDLRAFNHALIAKEQLSRNELLEVRKELIKGFSSGKWDITCLPFGIKQMGKIDENAFVKACMLKFPAEEAPLKAEDLCYRWQSKLRNSEWCPFKVVGDGKGNFQEVVKEEDQSLTELKNEWGEDIYNAVVIAFKELNEYNPRARYPVPELWNFKDNTKACLKQVIFCIFN